VFFIRKATKQLRVRKKKKKKKKKKTAKGSPMEEFVEHEMRQKSPDRQTDEQEQHTQEGDLDLRISRVI
jgi:hypothetical protein